LGDALVSFRSSVIGSISGRGAIVTGADALQQLSQFAVLFVAVLAIQGGLGGNVNLAEAFAAFAIARLAQFIPIPPGGLGTTDAILTGILTGFGMSSSDAMAADLIWRAATYFPQVLIGIGTLLVWRRRQRTTAKLTTQGWVESSSVAWGHHGSLAERCGVIAINYVRSAICSSKKLPFVDPGTCATTG
jgi:uncharacterized protein (TIRG00374 family)